MLPRSTKQWVIQPAMLPDVGQALAEYPEFFRKILHARGVNTAEDAKKYLACQVPFLEGPFALKGMEDAVACLLHAIDHNLPVAVYGDYDVDGVTATALMTLVLKKFGVDVVIPYIPNRFDEGYGLNNEALDSLARDGIRLVLTVDCGIRSPREVDHAHSLGMTIVISDHHHPGVELPAADAVICPKQDGCQYPEKNLSGAGLAYKIAQALVLRHPDAGVCAEDYLDLVALGTVADVVPLTGENRTLVRLGLDTMRTKAFENRKGLYSLAGVAQVNLQRVTATDVAFMLGPRLNAAGRLETAQRSLQLLMTDSRMDAGLWAQQLDSQNRERQELTRKTQQDAEQRAAEEAAEDILFAFHTEYNPGIVGLAASRLVDSYYRPAIVGQIEESVTRASCRSIPEFHITQALDACSDLLERHGGHALAAGFTVRNENRPELVRRLREIAASQLGGKDLRRQLHADLEVPIYELQRQNTLRYLDMLQPTGQGNSEAVFVSRNVEVRSKTLMGKEKQHLRLTLSNGNGGLVDAVAFRQGHKAADLPAQIDLMYTFELNVYNGQSKVQLNVRDLKPAGEPD